MRSLRCAAMLFAASSVGCFGVYVEGQATYYPSLKYTENDNPDPAAKVAPPTGGAFAVGINLGIDFEGQRSGRFALGYVVQTMPVPDGKATGGQTDARFEIKLARLAAAQRLRLGLGFGLGNATTTMKKADGTGDAEKKGGMGSFYGGLVYAHYFGKHNEIAVGGYGQYFAVSAPNGTLAGPGFGVKATFRFTPGDTRPSTSRAVPLDSSENLMPAIEAGAKRAGCQTTYREYRGQSSSLIGAGVVATCGAQTIEFFQVKEGVLIECEHMEEEECEAIESKILDGVKANRAEKNAPIQP